MRSFSAVSAILFALLMVVGCSSSGSPDWTGQPILPAHDVSLDGAGDAPQLWGLYEFTIDAENETIDAVQLRTAEMELNLLPYLEPAGSPPFLTILHPQFNLPTVSCDISIRHPFPSMPQFAGFMVRGVVLTDGSKGGFSNLDLVMSGANELKLTNPDGYTRWMNPVEFPYNGTPQNYVPGKMGDPLGHEFHSTINGYKLFADGLNEFNDGLLLPEAMKSAFTAGSINKRHYNLNVGTQTWTKFQYAVVASWHAPLHNPPIIPDDFPLGTVAKEPFEVSSQVLTNTLFNDGIDKGGDLWLRVNVRDFENGNTDQVFIEANDHFPRQQMTYMGQTGLQASFELTVANVDLPDAETFEVLIAAVAPDGQGYGGKLAGEECALYGFTNIDVALESQGPEAWPFYDPFDFGWYVWTAHATSAGSLEYWGIYDSNLDATGGGDCYEEQYDAFWADQENPNFSSITSPLIEVPASGQNLLLTIHHVVDVDPITDPWAKWAWDMCFVKVNGQKVEPTGGTLYMPDTHYPWSFDEFPCWTDHIDYTMSEFDLGTAYNGSTVELEFVLDTFDYIYNCNPPYFGWKIDDVTLDFAP